MKNLWKPAMALLAAASLAALGTLSGCGGGGGGTSQPNPAIRYINSIPDSTAVDFALNGNVTASSLAFAASSTNFTTTPPGDDDVTITEHGQAQSLWDEVDTFSANNSYVITSVGIEGYGTENLKRPQLVVSNVNRAVPNGTKARLIVVHGFIRAAGTDTSNIDFANPGLNFAPWAIGNIPFATSQVTSIDAGSVDIQARHAGTTQVFVEKTLTFTAGHVYMVIVTGIEGGTGAQAPDMKLVDLQTLTQ